MTNRLMGIDLAWSPGRNGSGIAVGSLRDGRLTVESVASGVYNVAALLDLVRDVKGLRGIAIDAPLIINNPTGRRPCERQLASVYSSRWAAPHASNLGLYPDAASVSLSQALDAEGYTHLGAPGSGKWQLECYPHPALIEVFGLDRRLAYKKGAVGERRDGQARLARLLLSLRDNPRLPLVIAQQQMTDETFIRTLPGKALKRNEDALDAIVCLYIAGLYAAGSNMQVFGDTDDGYIVVPPPHE